MKASSYDTLISRLLLATCRRQDSRWVRPWWQRLYNSGVRRNRPVSLTIHGHNTLTNFGNSYAYTIRRFPTFNAPLLDLIEAAFSANGRALRVVDVGAATGDGMLLIDSNCPGMAAEYVCVDGDPEFFRFLTHNLTGFPNVRLIQAQLSRSAGSTPSLVRTHAGTASAQGKEMVSVVPLDELLRESQIASPVDVLKIDVDGFDGAVLAGSRMLLERDRPFVIFEWHPTLCRRTGNDWREAFCVLAAADYATFLWFNKFGNFSHVTTRLDETDINFMAGYCLADESLDWHYDVVGLHPSRPIDIERIISGKFSRRRRSPL